MLGFAVGMALVPEMCLCVGCYVWSSDTAVNICPLDLTKEGALETEQYLSSSDLSAAAPNSSDIVPTDIVHSIPELGTGVSDMEVHITWLVKACWMTRSSPSFPWRAVHPRSCKRARGNASQGSAPSSLWSCHVFFPGEPGCGLYLHPRTCICSLSLLGLQMIQGLVVAPLCSPRNAAVTRKLSFFPFPCFSMMVGNRYLRKENRAEKQY